jgi:hypothetical protein
MKMITRDRFALRLKEELNNLKNWKKIQDNIYYIWFAIKSPQMHLICINPANPKVENDDYLIKIERKIHYNKFVYSASEINNGMLYKQNLQYYTVEQIIEYIINWHEDIIGDDDE